MPIRGRVPNEQPIKLPVGEIPVACHLNNQEAFSGLCTASDEYPGLLAVSRACNSLAAAGTEPKAVQVFLFLPIHYEASSKAELLSQVKQAAGIFSVDITAIDIITNESVECPTVKALASAKGNEALQPCIPCVAKPGDDLILTKYAAFEATLLLGKRFYSLFDPGQGSELLCSTQKRLCDLNTVKESTLALRYGVNAIINLSEKGILGAVWDLYLQSGFGVEIESNYIPVLENTRIICSKLDLDPLKLPSTGSLLISTPNGESLLRTLHEDNIKATIIGRVVFGKKLCLLEAGGQIAISAPEAGGLPENGERKRKGEKLQ